MEVGFGRVEVRLGPGPEDPPWGSFSFSGKEETTPPVWDPLGVEAAPTAKVGAPCVVAEWFRTEM